MAGTPKVLIIILNWNGLKDTLECLDSIYRLDYPAFEVIVVDNASSDNSVEVMRNNYPRITVIENSANLGFTVGNNIAMQFAMEHGADYVWLLNNDTVVGTDTLSRLVNCAESSPDIGMVSPVVYFYHEPALVQFRGSYIDSRKMTVIYPDEDRPDVPKEFIEGRNTCLWGTALLVKRQVVEKTGYLREDYFAYWEDTDYCIRAIRNGFRNVVATSTKIYHKTVPPKPGIRRRRNHFYYYMARNRYIWGMLHSSGLVRLSFRRSYFADLLSLYNHAHQGHISQEIADAHLTGAGDALRGKTGQWDGSLKSPSWLKKTCSLLCSWHPFFWIDLLNGEIGKIGGEICSRTRTKLTKLLN